MGNDNFRQEGVSEPLARYLEQRSSRTNNDTIVKRIVR